MAHTCRQLSLLDYNALDFLLLLWPDSLVDLIALETNRYAAHRGVKNWVPISGHFCL